jgi:hypothetical protein
MSLGAWERQALDSIADGLAGSAPGLASLLAIFGRLAAGEAMPVREKLQALRQDRTRRRWGYPRRGNMRPDARRPGLGWQQAAWPLLWLLVSAGLITVTMVLSRGGHSACTQSWGVCGG